MTNEIFYQCSINLVLKLEIHFKNIYFYIIFHKIFNISKIKKKVIHIFPRKIHSI